METEKIPQEMPVMRAEAQKEHGWLQRLVGEWTSTHEVCAPQGAAEPDCGMAAQGCESVRALGDVWVVAEGKGEMPGGVPAIMQVTLGYDGEKKRFVGTWVGSMMTHLWVYEGELDADESALSLYTEGPAMTGQGTAKYKDVIAFQSDDERTLTSYAPDESGEWRAFMTMRYHRVK